MEDTVIHDSFSDLPAQNRESGRHRFLIFSFLLVAVILLSLQLAKVPHPWFDEGWAMSVAKNWVSLGHYGQLLNGQPTSASMLNMGFPAIAPIALSFRLLGIGVWQGRLPSILFTFAALLIIHRLARRIFNPAVAATTLFVLVFASPFPTLLYGKQALAELPLLFYLVAGFFCFVHSWNRPTLFLAMTIVSWALAMATKLHVLPFLLLSLIISLCLAAYYGYWKTFRHVAISLLGSLSLFLIFRQLQEHLLQDRIMSDPGVYSLTAFVWVFPVRIEAMWVVIILGSTTVVGLLSELWLYIKPTHRFELSTGEETARFLIFLLVGSWTAWYALLSVGWQRYLYVPVFLGSVFFASFLQRIAAGYRRILPSRRGTLPLRHHYKIQQSAGWCFALLLILFGVTRNVYALYSNYISDFDDNLASLIHYTNETMVSNSMVETCDWEVIFLLPCRYHYPPNDVQLNLNRRAFLGEDLVIRYNALCADPDYLIVGEKGRFWHLYNALVETGTFRPIFSNGRYTIYERVRH